jgi:outer membrane protein assembly factor BamB
MMNKPYRLLALTLSLATAVLGADVPEWPQFRGPQCNPISNARLPDTWSKTENVEWLAEIPGRGWSSPIVSGGKVFLTTTITDGKSKQPQIGTEYSNEYVAELMKQGLSEKEVEARVVERDFEMPNEVMLHYFLYCFDLKTGKALWKQEYHSGRPPGGRHRKNSFTSETPVTDGKRVYVYATNLGLYAYDMKGKPVWKTPLEAYPIYNDFGTGPSPTLAGNLLLVVNDNEKHQFIAAFDKNTGKEVWHTNRDLAFKRGGVSARSAWSTPYVWTTSGAPKWSPLVPELPSATICPAESCGGCRAWRRCRFRAHTPATGFCSSTAERGAGSSPCGPVLPATSPLLRGAGPMNILPGPWSAAAPTCPHRSSSRAASTP